MSVLPIALMGNPVLRKMAELVKKDEPIGDLINNMIDTLMAQDRRLGLAAPQVSINKRIFVYRLPKTLHSRYSAVIDQEIPLTVLINPVLEPSTQEIQEGTEACLSIPGLIGMVPRWTNVKCTYTDTNGNQQVLHAQGFHARVLQHECDHLDGILYPYRMTDLTTLSFESECHS